MPDRDACVAACLLFPTFGVSEGQFSTVNIVGGELEHLADSHPTTGHKLQHETVSWIRCSEDDFINNLIFRIVQWIILAGLNSFLSIGVLQGFSMFGAVVFLTKLKKDERAE